MKNSFSLVNRKIHTWSINAYKGIAVIFLLAMMPACDNQENPEFSLPANAAYDLDMNRYKDKWLVLNYWAEWCLPCIKEIPELNQLDREHSDNINVVGVNFDHLSPEALLPLVEKMAIEFDVVINDPADLLKLSPAQLPTTYIFDHNGQLTAKLVGPQTVEGLLEKSVLLAEDK